MSSTPYDDVFHTLLNDCRQLVLPMLNEVFGTRYTGGEKIVFSPNEHFLNQQGGEGEKRITDSCFLVEDSDCRRYHWECESKEDKTMLVRFFEYGSQIALDYGRIKRDTLEVDFPNAAMLALRAGENTKDKMKIRIRTPGGMVSYDVPVMKMGSYTMEEIFQKKLLFLIPFYIFNHEKEFRRYERDAVALQGLCQEYEWTWGRLEELCQAGVISEYTKCTLIEMSVKVLTHIAVKYDKIRKGVRKVMGGQILEYEAKTIRNEGRAEGKAEGEKQKAQETTYALADMGLPADKIAKAVKVNLKQVKEWLEERPAVV